MINKSIGTSRKKQILICDDDPLIHLSFKQILGNHFHFYSAYNGDEALSLLKHHPIDLALLDIRMRSETEGLRYIPKLLDLEPGLAIIISSGLHDFDTVREAMRLGALDYMIKECGPDEFHHAITRALEKQTLLEQQKQHSSEVRNLQNQHLLIGESWQIRALKRDIQKIRNSTSNVLIFGETGTGKELVARQLRTVLPQQCPAPFIAVDSATIQSSTAESLLFGHERGAFTGAEKTTKGIFEEANGGTVYFDEIANMPLQIQAKLLRVLQEKEITRLGSSKVIPLEFRVVCATNRDLEQMITKGEFKDDLLQRIDVIPIYLAPLRERTDDIPLLVEFFLKKHSRTPVPALIFTPEAIEVLKAYPWPGNVRELNNLIAYLITMTDGDQVDIADLPPKFRDLKSKASSTSGTLSYYSQVANFEKDLLEKEYQRHDGKVAKIALSLEMDRSYLYNKLKEYGIYTGKLAEPRT